MIKLKYLTRKVFEICTKIIISIQGVALISGPTLYYFYGYNGFVEQFKGWDGYTTSRIDNMDAVTVFRKRVNKEVERENNPKNS